MPLLLIVILWWLKLAEIGNISRKPNHGLNLLLTHGLLSG
jgi:hypothetical protein